MTEGEETCFSVNKMTEMLQVRGKGVLPDCKILLERSLPTLVEFRTKV